MHSQEKKCQSQGKKCFVNQSTVCNRMQQKHETVKWARPTTPRGHSQDVSSARRSPALPQGLRIAGCWMELTHTVCGRPVVAVDAIQAPCDDAT